MRYTIIENYIFIMKWWILARIWNVLLLFRSAIKDVTRLPSFKPLNSLWQTIHKIISMLWNVIGDCTFSCCCLSVTFDFLCYSYDVFKWKFQNLFWSKQNLEMNFNLTSVILSIYVFPLTKGRQGSETNSI